MDRDKLVCWAFVAALAFCVALGAVLLALLAVNGPSVTLDLLITADVLALFALAGVRPPRVVLVVWRRIS